ncbi:MAG: alpha/beta fold hydrolase [Sandaracinaceae bacterium]|nr:alpha/beta fold hydrolase [Sandaracinaceae bacterium]
MTDLTISRSLYPFDAHYFDAGGARMHYLDEGDTAAEPIVMVHGNPTWSFYYRSLVKALRPRYRCVVPDHVGMGMSDKPDDGKYPYTLARRVDDLERLLDHVRIDRDVTLVLHDWGGMIGMAWAARHPERVARLVVLNTAAFHLPGDKSFPWPLRLTRTPVGAALVRGLNAFSEVASRVCVTRAPMPDEIRRAYVAPYGSYADRIATLRFVQDIPLSPSDAAYRVVSETQKKLHLFAHLPALICWGDRDFVFDHAFLREWRRYLPEAKVVRFPDCGHYVLEDATEEIVELVKDFLREHPLPARA